jgi:hypothetical protein
MRAFQPLAEAMVVFSRIRALFGGVRRGGARQQVEKCPDIDGFHEVMVETGRTGTLDVRRLSKSRHRHHESIGARVAFAQAPRHAVAVQARQANV